MVRKTLKIGTRGSPLALKQAEMTAAALCAAHDGLSVEIIPIKTAGDWKPAQGETRLSEAQGGKGLFVKEIEAALLRGDIDAAVHSMKDVPSFLPEGAVVDHVLPRADARDALICFSAASIEALPEGATVGTSSLRRQSFLLSRRPDLTVVPLRGNVQTRIDKLKGGQTDATLLAMAGLARLNITNNFIHPVGVDVIVPACGQGIVAIETRREDVRTRELLDAIHHFETGLCAAAERAALQTLDGSCHTPIGAHARFDKNEMSLVLAVGSPDGAHLWEEGGTHKISDVQGAAAFGHEIAQKLKRALPQGALA